MGYTSSPLEFLQVLELVSMNRIQSKWHCIMFSYDLINLAASIFTLPFSSSYQIKKIKVMRKKGMMFRRISNPALNGVKLQEWLQMTLCESESRTHWLNMFKFWNGLFTQQEIAERDLSVLILVRDSRDDRNLFTFVYDSYFPIKIFAIVRQ